MIITEQTRISDIASTLPSSVRVFQRHGIDFCCGGKAPLATACAERGLSFPAVVRAIEVAAEDAPEDLRDWNQEPLSALVAHIVTTFHMPLRDELPRLEAMAEKVSSVHGDKAPHLKRISRLVAELSFDLLSHMRKEENALFPSIVMIEADLGRPIAITAPVAMMEHEHDRAGAVLDELRAITGAYEPPEWACATFRALYHGLDELESTMHVHVHLENNILFPRAMSMAEAKHLA